MHAGAQTTVPSSHRRGKIGHAELTAEGLGDPLLALFDKPVRSLDEARISSFVADIIAEARTKGDTEPLKNLCPRQCVKQHRFGTGPTNK